MRRQPAVSVIIPALNEDRDIEGCLAAIAAQTYPAICEVVLVDGCSPDATVAVARTAAARYHIEGFRVVSNARRRTSTSLNAGLATVTGDVVVRLDARSRVSPDYVETCVRILGERPDVGVVGGAQVATARSARAVDVGIARALRNRWSTGLSRYRRSTASGPADTVWMGAFRTGEIRQLGGWDADVALNEDYELNSRYRSAGWLVWFDASLRSGYIPRPSLRALTRQYFRFGRVKGTWWARGTRPAPRQAVLLAAPVVAVGAMAIAAAQFGWLVALTGAAIAPVVVDWQGSRDGSASLAARGVAVVAVTSSCGGWWAGVVAGFVGQVLGRGRRDG